ncbi:MAG: LytTR family DNA-binding domain-containing protein [Defluviitaleaceae bacterium]|nr:LytTR family DNA-binding domain-containing protein [Defluviitaleaceae bacterium]
MLKLFICEKKKDYQKYIYDIVKSHVWTCDYSINIEIVTNNENDIFDYLEKNQTTGIYFLSICRKSKNICIENARRIRDLDIDGYIIFVSSEKCYLKYVIKNKIEPLEYIFNSSIDFKKEIIACIDYAYKKYISNSSSIRKIFSFKSNDERIINLKLEDIFYFAKIKNSPHMIKVISEKSKFEFRGNLKETLLCLNNDFYRCHKSYIVNLKKIKEINKGLYCVVMDNDKHICVSKRRFSEFLRVFKSSN